MSDTKLRPEDLTSEERALFHQVAIGVWLGQPGAVNGESIDEAFDSALRYIEFSRALFAPAPGEAAKVETHICEFCSKEFEEEAIRYGQATLPTPAPPEPAAHEDAEFLLSGALSMARIIERDELATPEMPEAVKWAIYQLRQNVRLWEIHGEQPASETDCKTADALESWWRTHAQPVAVGMSNALARVLDCAEMDANRDRMGGHEATAETTMAAIREVRQQAAQPPRLEKARRAIEFAENYLPIQRPERWGEYRNAAFEEIDAHEGKGEGRG